MAVVINGSGTVTGLAVGGLPDGTVDAGTLADDAVVEAKIAANAVVTGKIEDGTIAAGDLASGVGDITEADQWRITSDFTGSANPVTDNWERSDSYGAGSLGTGMTVSSGIFTFPSTGIWRVQFTASFRCTSENRYSVVYIKTTSDNSAHYTASRSRANQATSADTYGSATTSFLFDVTNTSTHKVSFRITNWASSTITEGNTNSNETHCSFLKLGET